MIPPLRLVREGEYVDDVLELILANVRTPGRAARRPARADRGEPASPSERLAELVERRGRETVEAVVRRGDRLHRAAHARDAPRAARRRARRAEGEIEGDGVDDDDIPIRVTVDDRRRRRWRSTSTGTAAAVAGNVNCPIAVTRSACLFALRVLLPGDVPGERRRVRAARHPRARGLARRRAAPVRGRGRQRRDEPAGRRHRAAALAQLVDGLPAQGQGTMNNLIIGGADWTYYETIGGGQGASPDGPGPVGRARRDEQHAQHARRGARARVPDAGRALRAGRRLGRRGAPPRRRRHRARRCGCSSRRRSRC